MPLSLWLLLLKMQRLKDLYMSSSSVYGVSAENVTEDHPLVPLTLYNKYKDYVNHCFLNI